MRGVALVSCAAFAAALQPPNGFGPPSTGRLGRAANALRPKATAQAFTDTAPTWGALSELLEGQKSAGEKNVFPEGRGPPTAKAELRLFDAPDGTEPRVVLYRDSASWCPYCQKVWMQLEEKRIPYRVERINMRCYGSKPAWFERDAGGLLPVVQIDGKLITDSVSILFALEREFPERTLLPGGDLDSPRLRMVRNLDRQFSTAWLGWLRSSFGKDNFVAALETLDDALAEQGGPYFCGAELTLCDLLVCSFLERAEASLLYFKGFRCRDADKFPNVAKWFDAMETRPAWLASMSDYYTHAHDLPPQLGGCNADNAADAVAVRRAIDGGEWEVGNEASFQPMVEHDAGAAKRAAAEKLISNHEAIATYMCRAHGPPGSPRVQAALADPNNASPVRWHIDANDAALRHVAHALLVGPEHAAETFSQGFEGEPVRAGLDYLRKRVGVPRDLSYPAARQLRQHLTWAMDQAGE